MNKVLAYIIDVFIAILLMFASVTIYFGLRMETEVKSIVKVVTNDFLTDAKKNGYITLNDYEKYMEKLSLTDTLYNVSFEQSYHVWEPEYRKKTLQEILDEQNASYKGNNVYTYREVKSEKPAVEDPINSGSLNTETNESVLAKAVNKPADPNHVHTYGCFAESKSNVGKVYFVYYIDPSGNQTVTIYNADNNHKIVKYGIQYGPNPPSRITNVYGVDTDLYNEDGSVTEDTKVIDIVAEATFGDGYQYTDEYLKICKPYNDDVMGEMNKFQQLLSSVGKDDEDITDVKDGEGHVINRIYNYTSNIFTPHNLQIPRFKGNPYTSYTKTYYTIEGADYDCDKIVTSISATHPLQTVAVGDPLITTVVATYLDGSNKVVVASTDFSTANIGKNQKVTLTYNYTVSEISYLKKCEISVTVIPRKKTCKNGHIYNLKEDGSDPGCPYCSAWVSSFSIINPVSPEMTITIGTTLKNNGVKLLATYYDGHTEVVTDGYEDNLDLKYLGTTIVTIGYKGVINQLRVTTVCKKVQCSICGNWYNLYPDGTDPGCPYCIGKIPVFTGNVLDYDESIYTEDILKTLNDDGIYILNKNDNFRIRISNKSSTLARGILHKILPSLSNNWLNLNSSVKISTNPK